MASVKTYLVPIDFSRHSGRALSYAVRLAQENDGRLILVHVITDSPEFVPFNLREHYYAKLKKSAEARIRNMVKRRDLDESQYRTLVIQGDDSARVIADQARKSRVSMIVMSSHGHTGLKRLVLGSVAEKTVRHARCPVLIVKP